MNTPTVRMIDKSLLLPDNTVPALRDALQKFVDYCFAPVWGTNCHLLLANEGDMPPDMVMEFLDNPTVPGAFGFHDVRKTGVPYMQIFASVSKAAGEPLSITASHELAEALVDPSCAICAVGPRNVIYAYETSDAVEEKSFPINGLQMSDFVTPEWFESYRKPNSTAFSFLKTVNKPFALDRGGYAAVFKSGRWTQIFGSERAKAKYKRKPHFRVARRAGQPVAKAR